MKTDQNVKFEDSALVEAVVWSNGNNEIMEQVRILELNLAQGTIITLSLIPLPQ